MKTEFLSETLVMKSLVEDSVINGARRDRRRVLIFTLFLLISSCNFQPARSIELYEYSTTPLDTMYSYIDSFYNKNPYINAYLDDSLNYTLELNKRNYYIQANRNSVVYQLNFSFSIDPYNREEGKRMCIIALHSGRKKGEIMKMAHKLSGEEKELYIKLFEEEFLRKLDSMFNIKGEKS